MFNRNGGDEEQDDPKELRKELQKAQKERDKAKQKVEMERRARQGGALTVGGHAALHTTSIIPESKEVRFLDAAVTGAVAATSVVWTATRPTALAQVGWAAFWSLAGTMMAVEGTGELRYAGFGLLSSNASFLALKFLHPDLHVKDPNSGS